jgi:pimeloyl-ACP methyl ester carboxylesterase
VLSVQVVEQTQADQQGKKQTASHFESDIAGLLVLLRRPCAACCSFFCCQMTTAFGEKGLLSHDHKMVYADPARLAKVTAPALFLVGDRDRMCPPEGCRRTWQVGGVLDGVRGRARHCTRYQAGGARCVLWAHGGGDPWIGLDTTALATKKAARACKDAQLLLQP